jgi:hypothetical protein
MLGLLTEMLKLALQLGTDTTNENKKSDWSEIVKKNNLRVGSERKGPTRARSQQLGPKGPQISIHPRPLQSFPLLTVNSDTAWKLTFLLTVSGMWPDKSKTETKCLRFCMYFVFAHIVIYLLTYFLMVLKFELRASNLLSRCLQLEPCLQSNIYI